MANPVPAPILDTRNGAQVAAAAIGALPSELSDRSDANPAVVLLEAGGYILDKLLYQVNRWPQGVIQKCLSLVGVNQINAAAATVTQTFTLSAPQQTDTTIPKGTQVSTSDGTIVFSTLADLVIKAYTTPSGTVSTTSGSTTVTGTSTSFVTDGTWNGWQIQIGSGGPWYTISSVTDATHLVLTSSATASTGAAVAFNVGAISGTVTAQATTAGSATNVAAAKLTTLVSSVNAVSTTTNAAAAAGGIDQETISSAIARAPTAFAARDVACSVSDYANFATAVLGSGGRVAIRPNYNGISTQQNGYVTIAMLSPNWTTASPISAQERANVIRDLAGRTFIGSTTVDIAPMIDSYTPAVVVWRKSQYDVATVQANIAAAINSYYSPNTYPWDANKYSSTSGYRVLYMTDLAEIVGNVVGVDRVHETNGVVACSMNWILSSNSIVFTNNSQTATANAGDIGANKITVNQTFLVDPNTGSTAVYLVTGISGTTLTLDRAFAGTTITANTQYFNSADVSPQDWTHLPYTNLSVDPTVPPASIIVTGSV